VRHDKGKRLAPFLADLRRRADERRTRLAKRRDGTGTDAADNDVIPIATWNVHSCVGIDARFSPDRTAEVLSNLGADIIGLQEVGWHHRGETGFDQFRYLAKATGMEVLAAPTKNGRRGHFGNAILTRFPVIRWEPFSLTLPGKEPRSGVDAVLDLGGRALRVMTVHLGLTPWERAQQLADVAERYERQPELPTLLMGDFNEWAVTASRLAGLSRRFPDFGCPPSFPAGLPTLRLDRFYVSAGLELIAYEAVRKASAFRASDHLPVVGRIALTKSGL
jgi:endonuclease/exonuclease/phosphatase family metal-dependent hydrolase